MQLLSAGAQVKPVDRLLFITIHSCYLMRLLLAPCRYSELQLARLLITERCVGAAMGRAFGLVAGRAIRLN